MPVPGPLAASVIGCLAYHPGVSPSGRNGVGFRAGQALICTAGLQQGGRHLRRQLSRSHGYLWCLEGGLHMVRSWPSASWQLQLRATAAKPSGRREAPGHDISLPCELAVHSVPLVGPELLCPPSPLHTHRGSACPVEAACRTLGSFLGCLKARSASGPRLWRRTVRLAS